MDFFKDLRKLERVGLIFFCFFVALQCISNAAANIALGVATFFLLLDVFFQSSQNNFERLKSLWRENKKIFFSFLIFWCAILLSALFSGEMQKGLKIFLGQFVYRTAPLFIILFFFRQARYAKFFLLLCIASCALDVLGSLLLQGFGPRLQGFFGSPMTLAGFLVVIIPVLFCCIMTWEQNKTGLLVAAFFSLVLFMGLLLNATRGAWLALAITLPFTAILYDRSSKKMLFLIALIAATSTIFLSTPHLQKRVESITSSTFQSNTERLLMWKSAYNMFKDNPIIGVGIGQYAPKYLKEYRSPESKEIQNHCHNNFLQMLAENGILGLLAFSILFGYLLYSSLITFWSQNNPFALLAFGVTLALLLQGMTEYNFGNSAVIKFYWTVLGCLLILTRSGQKLSYLFTIQKTGNGCE